MDSITQKWRRLSVVTVVLALGLGCASSGGGNELEPTIAIEQLPEAEFVVKRGSAISVAYRLTIQNPRDEPITLRGLELNTDTRSPYEFESNDPVEFDVVIESGSEEFVAFDTWIIPRERRTGNMVRLKATAHFESASGRFEVSSWLGFREPE